MADAHQPRNPGSRPAPPASLALRCRRLHAGLAPLVLVPLLITVASGMGYRLLRDWGGLDRDRLHWLMVLHEGEWLGSVGETWYVALNGLGLLWMLVSGAVMAWQRLRRP
ncbi:MAG: peptidase [Cyanobacteriota bacterium]|nr:peptidase [Cyanobacteriota bacterium]